MAEVSDSSAPESRSGSGPSAKSPDRAPFVDPTEIPQRPESIRLFGTPAFLRLWMSQVLLSLGDWIGFVAITALAARVGGSSPEASVGLVLSARLIPGFFLAPIAGVLVDRWDRKKVLVLCSAGRGVVLMFLPFVDTVIGLFAVSLALEILGLMWSPAEGATVPRIVPAQHLPTANSLSLVAAYGTFPLGSLVFALLAKGNEWLVGVGLPDSNRLNQENLAFAVFAILCITAAGLIYSTDLPHQSKRTEPLPKLSFGNAFQELADGWRFIGSSPLVRSVMLGLATGLIGGGMLVPLGPVFATRVLGAGSAGFGLLLTGMGFGTAIGVVLISVLQRHLPHERVFVAAVFGCGAAILLGASMATLTPAMLCVSVLGLCAGTVYVLGFSIIQSDVDDELRGRIFATLYTAVRFCLLLAFAAAPVISSLLDGASGALFDNQIQLGGVNIALPGVRLTLWLGGGIIITAGVLATLSMRRVLFGPADDTPMNAAPGS
ncbi:MAG TPA: MFS transporter [Acidimicrobiales bacterium]|nr:MFS transporter [Acidimicrobiales bacterium]